MPNRTIPAAGGAMPGLPPSPAPRRTALAAPLTPFMRQRMEAAVNRLIAVLDALDAPGTDLEDDAEDDRADLEASLGAFEGRASQTGAWSMHPSAVIDPTDLELDEADMEDDGTREPSLAAPENHPSCYAFGCGRDRQGDQTKWAGGVRDDRELFDDDREPDVEDEPLLGATEAIDHRQAWAAPQVRR